ncbi:MAG: YchF/TatD family DNA exonuclease [Alphaproteobacteria bacterium]|nr:YchF/TatD family DNA exonuclease [Alphaproteobacteria bacterium]
MLVDSHCHLDFPQLISDIDGVVARAGDAGVGMMLTISTALSRFDGVLAIAERFDNIYCTVGVHPHEAEAEPDTVARQLVARAAHPKVVGIGETGLDYFYEHSPRDIQQHVFREHIKAARETGLPLIVHTRDADDDTARILAEEMEQGAYPGLIHCFSSSRQLALHAVDLGLYISISGIATFKKAEDLRDTIRQVPLDRLLVETDSPYLAPVPKRGKDNEPSFVVHTANTVAGLKGLSPEALADATTDNFFRLFAKATRP